MENPQPLAPVSLPQQHRVHTPRTGRWRLIRHFMTYLGRTPDADELWRGPQPLHPPPRTQRARLDLQQPYDRFQ